MECSATKLVRKLLGKSNVEAVLQWLDRLTVDEAQMTATQTLEVIYALLQNMRVVKTHNIACGLRHTGTTVWFLRSDAFSEWKLSGPSSLLWAHGKRP
jgi:hypothetical protein